MEGFREETYLWWGTFDGQFYFHRDPEETLWHETPYIGLLILIVA